MSWKNKMKHALQIVLFLKLVTEMCMLQMLTSGWKTQFTYFFEIYRAKKPIKKLQERKENSYYTFFKLIAPSLQLKLTELNCCLLKLNTLTEQFFSRFWYQVKTSCLNEWSVLTDFFNYNNYPIPWTSTRNGDCCIWKEYKLINHRKTKIQSELLVITMIWREITTVYI